MPPTKAIATVTARLVYRCRHSEIRHIPIRERVDSNGQIIIEMRIRRRIVRGPCKDCRRQRRSSLPSIGSSTMPTDEVHRRCSVPCLDTAAGQLPAWFGDLVEGFETSIARHSTLRRARLSYSTLDRRRDIAVRRKPMPSKLGRPNPNLDKPLPAFPESPTTSKARRRRQRPQPLNLTRAMPQHAFFNVFAYRSPQTPPSPAWSFGSRFDEGRGRVLPTKKRDVAAEVVMIQAGNAARTARRVGGRLAEPPRGSTLRLV